MAHNAAHEIPRKRLAWQAPYGPLESFEDLRRDPSLQQRKKEVPMMPIFNGLWPGLGRVFTAVLIIALAGRGEIAAAPLVAGVGVENITVSAPTQPVHDPLFAKVLVVDDGATRAVVVCLDLICVSDSLTAAVRRQLHGELNIAESRVLINASHNHHTLGQVTGDLVARIVRAARRATESLCPVTIRVGTGREDRITINRRLRMKDGKHWTIRRATPSPKDETMAGLGPLDPEIGLLRLDRMDGKPLALLFNFACHVYGGVPGGAVTADLPGFASRVIEEAWPGATAMFVQGAAGDVTPIRYKDFDAPPPTEQLGTRLGLSALHAAQRLSASKDDTVRVESATIDLPRRTDIPLRIKSLLAQQEEILRFFSGVGCGAHGAGTPLNFKSFLPLYMKHVVDPQHPAYASYLYEQEQATGQDGLRTLDVENKKRLENYVECLDHMERLIVVQTSLQLFQQQLRQAGARPLRPRSRAYGSVPSSSSRFPASRSQKSACGSRSNRPSRIRLWQAIRTVCWVMHPQPMPTIRRRTRTPSRSLPRSGRRSTKARPWRSFIACAGNDPSQGRWSLCPWGLC